MTLIDIRLETRLLHLCLLNQSITLHWSRNMNLFRRHVHIETRLGIALLSQDGIIIRRRLTGKPPVYRLVYSAGPIRKHFGIA